jgi:hypothetical protein
VPTAAESVIAYARAQIGKPYVWGGEGEYDGSAGYDCSGLIYAAFRTAGLTGDGQPGKGRTIASQLGKMGAAVSRESAIPGDLVYFDNPGPTDHVGIYIGNGQMIDAPTQGQPIAVRSIRTPTSIRRIPGIFGKTDDGRAAGSVGNAPTESSGVLDALNPLSLFESWQLDAVNIGLKITAGLVVGGLFIVGAREAFAERTRA